jgi:hypothetical protein
VLLEVLTKVNIKISFFWDMTPHSLAITDVLEESASSFCRAQEMSERICLEDGSIHTRLLRITSQNIL